MIFRKDELRLLWPFYLSGFILMSLAVASFYYYVYLASIGLSYTQIGIIFAAQALVCFLFELPTGSFGDVFSNKAAVLTGSTLILAFFIITPFLRGFWPLLAIFSLQSIGSTFISGADEAWVVNVLRKKRRYELLDSYFANEQVFVNAGMIISPLLAGFIVQFSNMQNLFFVHGAGYMIFILILFFAYDPHRRLKHESIITKSRQSFNFVLGHKKILYLISATLIMMAAYEMRYFGHTLYIQELGINLAWIGYAFAIISAAGLFTPRLSLWLNKILKVSTSITTIISAQALLLLSFAIFSNAFYALLILIVFGLLNDIRFPLHSKIRNIFLPDRKRASILSLMSMAEAVPAMIGSMLAGIIADAIGLRVLLILSGAILIPAAVLFYKVKK